MLMDNNILNGMMDSFFGNKKLTSEDIHLFKTMLIEDIIFGDIQQHDYSGIQKLFEGGSISNEQLAEMVDTPRFIGTGISEMVYCDMVELLCKKILSDSVLDELFVSVYSKKYRKGCQEAKKIIQNNSPSNRMNHMDEAERLFCTYMLLDNDNVLEASYLDSGMISGMQMAACIKSNLSLNDYEDNMRRYRQITFSETEDSILLSKQFDRFLSKRRAEIADYMDVDEEEVSDFIASEMDFSDIGNEKSPECMKAKHIASLTLMANNGGVFWLRDFAGSESDAEYHYEAGVDRIIKLYYTVQVISMYNNYISETGRFTKIDLSRGWESNPGRDIQGICDMYCMDMFYNMFAAMMKNFYKTFSWEKITAVNMQQRYSQMVNELNIILEEKNNQITSLNRQLSLFKAQKPKDNSDGNNIALECERKQEKLIKDIEQRDREIVRLKDYIRSQDEFHEIQSREEPEENYDVNIDDLQGKRYLFVGSVNIKLKRDFPGSIFMESENLNISDIVVDAIVFMTKGMSHAMFYKVKNSPVYKKVPSVMCNTKNIDRIYYDMDRQLDFD